MKLNAFVVVFGLLVVSTMSQNVQAFALPQTPQAQAASKLAYIQLKASQGESEAQFLLGLMYLSGRFVDADIEQGLVWVKRAAEQGHEKATKTLADLAFDGKLIPRDLALAEHWYQQLAQKEDKWAQFRLGFIYAAGGKGIVRNCGKAVDYFTSVGDQVSLGNVVWILSTCPEPEYRNGVLALEIGKDLVATNTQDPTYLDNLAAAYAEIGDYSAAVHTQQKAIEALKHAAEQNRFDEFEARLQNYQQQKPYREVLSLSE